MRSRAAAGRVIVDRYELVEPLGEGPLGPLWRARDRDSGRDVVVREIELPELLDEVEQAALAEKVLREARAAARLTHRAVVPVLEVVAVEGYPFVVTELVEAPSLADVVALEGPLPSARAAAIGLELLDALAAAHDRGLVHRDVQPSNVFLDGERTRLADFGVASVVDDPRISTAGAVAPFYLAPEQSGNAGGSPASDMWSLAATIYFAVEGSPPFAEADPVATLDAIRSRGVPLSARAGRLRPLFDVLLVKDPLMRAGRDRARALLAWAAEEPVTPLRPAPRPTPDVRPDVRPESPPGGGAETVLEPPEPPRPAPPPQPGASTTEPDAVDVTADGPAPAARPAVSAPSPDGEVAPDDDARIDGRDGEIAVDAGEEPTLIGAPVAPGPNGDWREPWFFGVPAEAVAPPPLPDTDALELVVDDGARRRRLLTRNAWIGILAVVTAIVMLGLITTGGRRLRPARPSVGAGTDGVPSVASWTPYTDDATGFSIRYPPEWTVRRTGNQTYFVHPDNIAYLEVDHQEPPAPSLVKAWEDLEKTFAPAHPSYAKIQIAPSTFQQFPAAIWEFTYTDNGVNLHTLDLGFTTPR
ncbi:MAG TPA: protein kinase, partial [Acidimicrobiales bacterium]|nr:protein kinase [Acidimicrobiales bacterium]